MHTKEDFIKLAIALKNILNPKETNIDTIYQCMVLEKSRYQENNQLLSKKFMESVIKKSFPKNELHEMMQVLEHFKYDHENNLVYDQFKPFLLTKVQT